MTSSTDLSSPPEILLTGSCFCRAVTYTITTLPSSMCNCHCQTCRKLSGGPFLTFAQFPTASITFSSSPTSSPVQPSGDALAKVRYSDIAERGHCSRCGSQLLMQYFCDMEEMSITVGSIDEGSVKDAQGLGRPGKHIFVAEKAAWYDIVEGDGLERWDGFSDGFQAKVNAWKKETIRERAA